MSTLKNNLKQKIQQLASAYSDEIIEIRRHVHQYPELAMQEYKTSDYIAAKLKEYKIPYKQGIAKTGVVGLIEGSQLKTQNSKLITVALRADMDALQIQEKNNISYKSKNNGVMHACGHDVHIACLLGAAKILNKIKKEFYGSVKLIFQPSEEKYPGGAIQMIKEGVLKNPKPDVVIALHTLPELEAGKIGVKRGKYMASTDEIYITIKGKGGHAATPDRNIDAILIASHIIIELQQIVSRNANPITPTVLSFGRIYSDGRTNIMPDEVKIEGTMRTFDEKWRQEIHKKIVKISKSVAVGMGGKSEVFIDKGYPFLVNNEELTDRIRINSQNYLGSENVEELEIRMTAEDFSYFSQAVPSCMYRLGIANKTNNITSNLHTSTFNVDEKSIETGMGLMAWLAVNEMKFWQNPILMCYEK